MNLGVEAVKEFVTDLVIPEKREHVNFIAEHVTVLQGHKCKKQHVKKSANKRAVGLSRREYAKLGLDTLPTRQMKYEEALPLHRLWKSYMQEHLGIKTGEKVPEVYEAGYDAFSKLFVKTDLHGAKLRVIESKCSTFVGIYGIVLMESKNVLKLISKDNKIRTIPKPECNFSMKLGNIEFVLMGKELSLRPAERAVRKLKNNIKTNTLP